MHSPASYRSLALWGLNCRKAPFLCDPDVTSVAAIAIATRAPCKLWDCKKVPNTWVAGRAVASHFLKEPILAHPYLFAFANDCLIW